MPGLGLPVRSFPNTKPSPVPGQQILREAQRAGPGGLSKAKRIKGVKRHKLPVMR